MRIRGTELTRAQVVGWNEAWSDLDRARVAAALDVFPEAAVCNLPPSETEIGVWVYGPTQSTDYTRRSEGPWMVHRGLIVHRGWLEWPAGEWCKDLDPALFPDMREDEKAVFEWMRFYVWHPLSTMRAGGRRNQRAAEKTVAVCPSCRMALPATGVCDFCT